MNFFILILYFGLFINIYCQIPVWNLVNSSIDLFSLSESYNDIIYDETKDGFHVRLKRYMEKKNGKISQKYFIRKNDEQEKEIEFEDIYNIYSIENQKFICPNGNNYLFNYSLSEIKEIKYTKEEINDNWLFTCYYDIYKKRLLVSHLGSNDSNIYVLDKNIDNWEQLNVLINAWGRYKDYHLFKIYDIIWPNKNDKYAMALILGKEGLRLARINTIHNSKEMSIEDTKDINGDPKNNTIASFDEDKYFYYISYDDKELLGGYSNTPIPDDISNYNLFYNNIDISHFQNSFSSFENIKINYANFIRNTKYVYYEIELNSTIYHGVIDIRKNQIIFNTNEEIKEFKPLTKYSLLAITDSSAYEICINGKFNGKCINKCPNYQDVIIDKENGNYCNLIEYCKILLLSDNSCIDKCDEDKYIQNGKECGFCKNVNKSYPYRIREEKKCLNEKPKNTYFYDESKYLLDYCHNSCETCYGADEYKCLSCQKSSFLYEGKCDTDCPIGFYGNKANNKCLDCDSNCKTCSNGKENNNNHCLSCHNGTYLVNARGFDNNCVSTCPQNTKLNSDTNECISVSDSNNPENYNEESNNTWVWILIISLIVIVLIIIAIIIYIKFFKNRKQDDVNLVLKSEDDIMGQQNESISQDWSVY